MAGIQCSHIKDDGDQCGRTCKPGFTVCAYHGANNPPAIAIARRALAFARMPAIESLYVICEQFLKTTCAACGYPSGDTDAQRAVIRAAQVVLDRTEMGPRSVLEIKQSNGDFDIRHLNTDERARLARILAEMRQLKQDVQARLRVEAGGPGQAPAAPEPHRTM